jgi:hypothetical protein
MAGIACINAGHISGKSFEIGRAGSAVARHELVPAGRKPRGLAG